MWRARFLEQSIPESLRRVQRGLGDEKKEATPTQASDARPRSGCAAADGQRATGEGAVGATVARKDVPASTALAAAAPSPIRVLVHRPARHQETALGQ